MPALESVAGWRVVATPAALDAARWHGNDVDVIRIAPDEALGIGATGVEVDDPDAIVERETGFVAAIVDPETELPADHIEWLVPARPDGSGVLVQGKIAGVPAKLLVDDPSLVITNAAYADELARRLRW